MWYLNPQKRRLISLFYEKGADPNTDQFEAFAYLWMAFNAFGSVATAYDSDWRIIQTMSQDDRMNRTFQQLLATDRAFEGDVQRFSALWPIYSERDAFRAYRRLTGKHIPDEEAMLELCRQGMVPRNPPTGDLTWANVLRAIYVVRCNLFHGGKTPLNLRDVDLVDASRIILLRMIEELHMR